MVLNALILAMKSVTYHHEQGTKCSNFCRNKLSQELGHFSVKAMDCRYCFALISLTHVQVQCGCDFADIM